MNGGIYKLVQANSSYIGFRSTITTGSRKAPCPKPQPAPVHKTISNGCEPRRGTKFISEASPEIQDSCIDDPSKIHPKLSKNVYTVTFVSYIRRFISITLTMLAGLHYMSFLHWPPQTRSDPLQALVAPGFPTIHHSFARLRGMHQGPGCLHNSCYEFHLRITGMDFILEKV